MREDTGGHVLDEDMERLPAFCQKEDYSCHAELEFWRQKHTIEGQSPGYHLKVLDSYGGLSTYSCTLWYFGESYTGIGTTPQEAIDLAIGDFQRDSW